MKVSSGLGHHRTLIPNVLLLLFPFCPQVVERFQEVSGHNIVEAAHMELAEPSILTGKQILHYLDCDQVHPYHTPPRKVASSW